MEQKQPIDIVITTWRREWMTQSCLQALRVNTSTPHRIILIDSGSNPENQDLYAHMADVYVKLDQNRGLEYAKYLGMQFVESPLFVSMDNDILPYKYEPDWLGQLVGLMDANPEYGAIALRPQILVGTGMAMFENAQPIVEFPHVPGYARLMRTDLVKRAGAWNEKRPLRGHEEMWIGGKFREMGYKMGWARDLRCWHLWGEQGRGEDMWGYIDTESGHNPVWPIPQNDWEEIEKRTGVRLS